MRSLRCRLGRHRWRTELTEDRQPYRVCSRCQHEDWFTPPGPDPRRTDTATRFGGGAFGIEM